jgi:hypothetical protein
LHEQWKYIAPSIQPNTMPDYSSWLATCMECTNTFLLHYCKRP